MQLLNNNISHDERYQKPKHENNTPKYEYIIVLERRNLYSAFRYLYSAFPCLNPRFEKKSFGDCFCVVLKRHDQFVAK